MNQFCARAALLAFLAAFYTPPAAGQAQQAEPQRAPLREGQQDNQAVPPGPSTGYDLVRRQMDWFYEQRAFPFPKIPAGARLQALKELEANVIAQKTLGILPDSLSPKAVGFPGPAAWTLIGPQGIGPSTASGSPPSAGRVSALAVDPTNASIVYLGGAQGGVWKSTDAGTTWIPKTDSQASLAIGSIAIDPGSCNPAPCKVIYAGTGEENFSGDSYYGTGILKSSDGGDTWTLIGASSFQNPSGGGARIGAIAIQPSNSQTLLAASTGGVYRSTDAGQTWTRVQGGSAATDVLFDPANGNVAYAALGAIFGAQSNGVYKSTDGGATWARADAGTGKLPTSNVGRIALAVAPSSTNILYAAIQNTNPFGSFLGLFKSTDSGANWTPLTNAPNFCGTQCWYDIIIRVYPTDPGTIFAGGVPRLLRSSDGGITWVDASTGFSGATVHTDHHALVFSNPAIGPVKLYDGNDGGVWRSDNPAALIPGTYDLIDLNATLAIAQFYPGQLIHPSSENIGIIGTQDNGTLSYTGNPMWTVITGGDGGWTVLDKPMPSTVFTSCQDFCSFRSFFNGGVGTFSVLPMNGIDMTDHVDFIPPYVGDPRTSGRIYFGTFRVYQSNDYGDSWTAVSPDVTGGSGVISAMAVAPSNPDVLYAVTTRGKIQRTINATAGASANWTDLAAANLPLRAATQVAVNPSDPNTAIVSFSGFGTGHVFLTSNGGVTWSDISGTGMGALPNMPVNDVVIDPDSSLASRTFYVGTDIGVFFTSDGGTTWSPLGTGLPHVAVFSLGIRKESRTIRAATHGRSAWLLQLTNLPVPSGPFLTSISPVTASAGSSSFNLTLDGANFSSNSKVLWKGSQTGVTITGANANQLVATVSPTLLTQVDAADISVVDGAQVSQNLQFIVTGLSPLITAVSPSSVTAGGSEFDMTISGGNFNCGGSFASSVYFIVLGQQNHLLNPKICASAQLVVTIPSALRAAVGGVRVVAFNPPPSGGDSNSFLFQVTPAGPLALFSRSTVPFSNTNVGAQSGPETVQLSNPGIAPLSLTSIGLSGPDAGQFGLVPSTGVDCRLATILAVGANCNISVQFVPTSFGSKNASISVTDNAPGSPHSVALSGTAIGPGITLSPANVTFGNLNVGSTSAGNPVQLSNPGNATLTINSITLAGADPAHFTLSHTCGAFPALLLAGGSCTITPGFKPTTTGPKTANLNIADNAPGNPHLVNVSGTGIDFNIAGPESSVSVAAGQPANFALSLTTSGGATSGVIALSASGNPYATTVTFNPANIPAGSTSANVTMIVTTTVRSLITINSRRRPHNDSPIEFRWLAWAVSALAIWLSLRLWQRGARVRTYGSVALLACALAWMIGCGGYSSNGGGGGSTSGTPAGTYTITVTATSGTTTRTATVSLVVN